MAGEAEQQDDPAISSSTQSPEESLAQGELEGAALTAKNMQEDSLAAEDTTRQRISTQEDALVCGPVQHDFGVLLLVTPTGGGAKGTEEADFVTWVTSPSKPAEQDTYPQTPHD